MIDVKQQSTLCMESLGDRESEACHKLQNHWLTVAEHLQAHHWGFGRLDLASLKVFLQKGIKFLLLSQRQGVDFTTRWFGSRYNFDSMIPLPRFWKDIK